MDLAEALGQTIKSRRVATGFTQARLAECAGLDVGSVSRFERGKILPSLLTLFILAEIMKTTPETMLHDTLLLKPEVPRPRVEYAQRESRLLKAAESPGSYQ